ncbi:hypothetical protein ACEPAI_6507 [Sanghuangporus weigelae]
MASSSSPEVNEELEALRRDKEYLKARLDFEIRQNKEEVDFLRAHCQKKLDFERERAKENETALEQRLLALRAEKDSQTQEFRKVFEQLETDKQQLQERECRLEGGRLAPTRLKNDQQFHLLVCSPDYHMHVRMPYKTLLKDLRRYLLLKSVVKQ